ncbi:unnamed protein product [Amoebophrya sp. A25]|nr:unnamed protein product [Amoebophrya sp. A25]|eukprot:GSA25T00013465001.1
MMTSSSSSSSSSDSVVVPHSSKQSMDLGRGDRGLFWRVRYACSALSISEGQADLKALLHEEQKKAAAAPFSRSSLAQNTHQPSLLAGGQHEGGERAYPLLAYTLRLLSRRDDTESLKLLRELCADFDCGSVLAFGQLVADVARAELLVAASCASIKTSPSTTSTLGASASSSSQMVVVTGNSPSRTSSSSGVPATSLVNSKSAGATTAAMQIGGSSSSSAGLPLGRRVRSCSIDSAVVQYSAAERWLQSFTQRAGLPLSSAVACAVSSSSCNQESFTTTGNDTTTHTSKSCRNNYRDSGLAAGRLGPSGSESGLHRSRNQSNIYVGMPDGRSSATSSQQHDTQFLLELMRDWEQSAPKSREKLNPLVRDLLKLHSARHEWSDTENWYRALFAEEDQDDAAAAGRHAHHVELEGERPEVDSKVEPGAGAAPCSSSGRCEALSCDEGDTKTSTSCTGNILESGRVLDHAGVDLKDVENNQSLQTFACEEPNRKAHFGSTTDERMEKADGFLGGPAVAGETTCPQKEVECASRRGHQHSPHNEARTNNSSRSSSSLSCDPTNKENNEYHSGGISNSTAAAIELLRILGPLSMNDKAWAHFLRMHAADAPIETLLRNICTELVEDDDEGANSIEAPSPGSAELLQRSTIWNEFSELTNGEARALSEEEQSSGSWKSSCERFVRATLELYPFLTWADILLAPVNPSKNNEGTPRGLGLALLESNTACYERFAHLCRVTKLFSEFTYDGGTFQYFAKDYQFGGGSHSSSSTSSSSTPSHRRVQVLPLLRAGLSDIHFEKMLADSGAGDCECLTKPVNSEIRSSDTETGSKDEGSACLYSSLIYPEILDRALRVSDPARLFEKVASASPHVVESVVETLVEHFVFEAGYPRHFQPAGYDESAVKEVDPGRVQRLHEIGVLEIGFDAESLSAEQIFWDKYHIRLPSPSFISCRSCNSSSSSTDEHEHHNITKDSCAHAEQHCSAGTSSSNTPSGTAGSAQEAKTFHQDGDEKTERKQTRNDRVNAPPNELLARETFQKVFAFCVGKVESLGKMCDRIPGTFLKVMAVLSAHKEAEEKYKQIEPGVKSSTSTQDISFLVPIVQDLQKKGHLVRLLKRAPDLLIAAEPGSPHKHVDSLSSTSDRVSVFSNVGTGATAIAVQQPREDKNIRVLRAEGRQQQSLLHEDATSPRHTLEGSATTWMRGAVTSVLIQICFECLGMNLQMAEVLRSVRAACVAVSSASFTKECIRLLDARRIAGRGPEIAPLLLPCLVENQAALSPGGQQSLEALGTYYKSGRGTPSASTSTGGDHDGSSTTNAFNMMMSLGTGNSALDHLFASSPGKESGLGAAGGTTETSGVCLGSGATNVLNSSSLLPHGLQLPATAAASISASNSLMPHTASSAYNTGTGAGASVPYGSTEAAKQMHLGMDPSGHAAAATAHLLGAHAHHHTGGAQQTSSPHQLPHDGSGLNQHGQHDMHMHHGAFEGYDAGAAAAFQQSIAAMGLFNMPAAGSAVDASCWASTGAAGWGWSGLHHGARVDGTVDLQSGYHGHLQHHLAGAANGVDAANHAFVSAVGGVGDPSQQLAVNGTGAGLGADSTAHNAPTSLAAELAEAENILDTDIPAQKISKMYFTKLYQERQITAETFVAVVKSFAPPSRSGSGANRPGSQPPPEITGGEQHNFAKRNIAKRSQVFEFMLGAFFQDIRYYPRYSDTDLKLAGRVIGLLLYNDLVTPIKTKTALASVTDSLKKPEARMWKFGIVALEQMLGKIATWPKLCETLSQMEGLKQAYPAYVSYLASVLENLTPAMRRMNQIDQIPQAVQDIPLPFIAEDLAEQPVRSGHQATSSGKAPGTIACTSSTKQLGAAQQDESTAAGAGDHEQQYQQHFSRLIAAGGSGSGNPSPTTGMNMLAAAYAPHPRMAGAYASSSLHYMTSAQSISEMAAASMEHYNINNAASATGAGAGGHLLVNGGAPGLANARENALAGTGMITVGGATSSSSGTGAVPGSKHLHNNYNSYSASSSTSHQDPRMLQHATDHHEAIAGGGGESITYNPATGAGRDNLNLALGASGVPGAIGGTTSSPGAQATGRANLHLPQSGGTSSTGGLGTTFSVGGAAPATSPMGPDATTGSTGSNLSKNSVTSLNNKSSNTSTGTTSASGASSAGDHTSQPPTNTSGGGSHQPQSWSSPLGLKDSFAFGGQGERASVEQILRHLNRPEHNAAEWFQQKVVASVTSLAQVDDTVTGTKRATAVAEHAREMRSHCSLVPDDALHTHYSWLALYIVKQHAATTAKNGVFLEFLEKLDEPKLVEAIVTATDDCLKLLMANVAHAVQFTTHRMILKNLGFWLGQLTIARNKPLLSRQLDLKALLFDAFDSGSLTAVLPLVCKILEGVAKSKVFRLPNPWTQAVLSLLAEIHDIENLRTNLVFEVEVLCKTLDIQIKDLKRSESLVGKTPKVYSDFNNAARQKQAARRESAEKAAASKGGKTPGTTLCGSLSSGGAHLHSTDSGPCSSTGQHKNSMSSNQQVNAQYNQQNTTGGGKSGTNVHGFIFSSNTARGDARFGMPGNAASSVSPLGSQSSQTQHLFMSGSGGVAGRVSGIMTRSHRASTAASNRDIPVLPGLCVNTAAMPGARHSGHNGLSGAAGNLANGTGTNPYVFSPSARGGQRQTSGDRLGRTASTGGASGNIYDISGATDQDHHHQQRAGHQHHLHPSQKMSSGNMMSTSTSTYHSANNSKLSTSGAGEVSVYGQADYNPNNYSTAPVAQPQTHHSTSASSSGGQQQQHHPEQPSTFVIGVLPKLVHYLSDKLLSVLPMLHRVVPHAVDNAIREIIGPTVERSIGISCLCTKEVVSKDFAMEGDENMVRKAAQLQVSSLAGHIAVVTAREPLRVAMLAQFSALLREENVPRLFDQALQNTGATPLSADTVAELQKLSSVWAKAHEADQARGGPHANFLGHSPANNFDNLMHALARSNLNIGCQLIEKAAVDKALAHIEHHMAPAVQSRKEHRQNFPGKSYADPYYAGEGQGGGRWPEQLPDILRPKPGPLSASHLKVYKDFQSIGIQPSPAKKSGGVSGSSAHDVGVSESGTRIGVIGSGIVPPGGGGSIGGSRESGLDGLSDDVNPRPPPLPEMAQWLSAFECRFFDKQPAAILAETPRLFELQVAEPWARDLTRLQSEMHQQSPDDSCLSFLKWETWSAYVALMCLPASHNLAIRLRELPKMLASNQFAFFDQMGATLHPSVLPIPNMKSYPNEQLIGLYVANRIFRRYTDIVVKLHRDEASSCTTSRTTAPIPSPETEVLRFQMELCLAILGVLHQHLNLDQLPSTLVAWLDKSASPKLQMLKEQTPSPLRVTSGLYLPRAVHGLFRYGLVDPHRIDSALQGDLQACYCTVTQALAIFYKSSSSSYRSKNSHPQTAVQQDNNKEHLQSTSTAASSNGEDLCSPPSSQDDVVPGQTKCKNTSTPGLDNHLEQEHDASAGVTFFRKWFPACPGVSTAKTMDDIAQSSEVLARCGVMCGQMSNYFRDLSGMIPLGRTFSFMAKLLAEESELDNPQMHAIRMGSTHLFRSWIPENARTARPQLLITSGPTYSPALLESVQPVYQWCRPVLEIMAKQAAGSTAPSSTSSIPIATPSGTNVPGEQLSDEQLAELFEEWVQIFFEKADTDVRIVGAHRHESYLGYVRKLQDLGMGSSPAFCERYMAVACKVAVRRAMNSAGPLPDRTADATRKDQSSGTVTGEKTPPAHGPLGGVVQSGFDIPSSAGERGAPNNVDEVVGQTDTIRAKSSCDEPEGKSSCYEYDAVSAEKQHDMDYFAVDALTRLISSLVKVEAHRFQSVDIFTRSLSMVARQLQHDHHASSPSRRSSACKKGAPANQVSASSCSTKTARSCQKQPQQLHINAPLRGSDCVENQDPNSHNVSHKDQEDHQEQLSHQEQEDDAGCQHFNQRPYFRIVVNLLGDMLHSPDSDFGNIRWPVLCAFQSFLFHTCPTRLPGFSFAWLSLFSHRWFLPALLNYKQQRGWLGFHRLMLLLLTFLEPHLLKNTPLSDTMRLLYKGTLRVLLVLLHDYPEFLSDYHFSFLEVVPVRCIQVRNLLLSAFPRRLRLPDPFAGLKVDSLPEIRKSPRILCHFAILLGPVRLTIDHYIQERSANRLPPWIQYNKNNVSDVAEHQGATRSACVHAQNNTTSTERTPTATTTMGSQQGRASRTASTSKRTTTATSDGITNSIPSLSSSGDRKAETRQNNGEVRTTGTGPACPVTNLAGEGGHGDLRRGSKASSFREQNVSRPGPTAAKILEDIRRCLLLPMKDMLRRGTKYDTALINVLVLYVGLQNLVVVDPSGTSHPSLEIFLYLVHQADDEGRYLILSMVANHLRFPNKHTHYFSRTLLYLFIVAGEGIQEIITRVLIERLIVHRPHPWGLLITFIELIKNPAYNFWDRPFVHCAPEIEGLFRSVGTTCLGADNTMPTASMPRASSAGGGGGASAEQTSKNTLPVADAGLEK